MNSAPSRIALAAVAIIGVINLVRGSIHLFAPDGGAVTIAGLDIDQAPQTILFLFASLGVGQIALGLVDIAAVWRWRTFVPPLLAIHAAQLALAMLAVFVLKPPPIAVPGQWFSLALFTVVVIVSAREFVMAKRT